MEAIQIYDAFEKNVADLKSFVFKILSLAKAMKLK